MQYSKLYHAMIRPTLLLLALVLFLPLAPYALANLQNDAPANLQKEEGVVNPGTHLWREIRKSEQGKTQVQGIDTSVLVSSGGQQWREYRMETLIPYSAVIFAGVIGLFVLYYLIRGRIRIVEGRSGHLIQRYSLFDRWVHWFMAAVFLILMLTGLVLLYGRLILIPWLGAEGFSGTAMFCKWVHNQTGLLFIVALVLMFFAFLREALFNLKVDIPWFLRAGGYLGGKHPSSGKINAGQKTWYWAVVLGGLVTCVTGIALDFPGVALNIPLNLETRELLRDAYVLHTLAAVFLIAFFFVHIYLGALGMEGSLEAMTRGEVDANWAREQHDLWYEEVKDLTVDAQPDRTSAPRSATPQIEN